MDTMTVADMMVAGGEVAMAVQGIIEDHQCLLRTSLSQLKVKM